MRREVGDSTDTSGSAESSPSGASSGEILKALQVCEYSKDETLLFLQKSKRYLEMGFEHLGIGLILVTLK